MPQPPRRFPKELLPPFAIEGGAVSLSECFARVFLASGGLLETSVPTKIRIVEGYPENGTVVYTGHRNGGNPVNWYDVAIINGTGVVKTNRP